MRAFFPKRIPRANTALSDDTTPSHQDSKGVTTKATIASALTGIFTAILSSHHWVLLLYLQQLVPAVDCLKPCRRCMVCIRNSISCGQ